MACPTMSTCSIVSCAYWMTGGGSPSPYPPPTHTEERGDYPLSALLYYIIVSAPAVG